MLWDGVVSGLRLRALPNGRKTWFVHRRVGNGLVKRTLSAADAMSVEDARRAARVLITEADSGGGAAMSVPTMQTFGPAFLADCAERWKPKTRAAHADNMQRFILPAFGNRRVDAITARDVRNWFYELSVTRAATANRSLAVLSSLMKHAEDLGLRPEGSNSGCNRAHVVHKPRLLSDYGSSYISGALAEWLEDHGMDHVRGAPYHPQTQGKIERWHQTLKNRILLENYYLPGDLENQISAFVDHYNNQRYHESIGNVTPADAYFGRHTAIIEKRKRIKN